MAIDFQTITTIAVTQSVSTITTFFDKDKDKDKEKQG